MRNLLIILTLTIVIVPSIAIANQMIDQALKENPIIIFDNYEGNKSQVRKELKKFNLLKDFCTNLKEVYTQNSWDNIDCSKINLNYVRTSFLGNPLSWYKSEKEQMNSHKNTVLISCGWHGNQQKTIKYCFDLISYINNRSFEDLYFVIAPIVSPDAVFRTKPKRTNQRAVDVLRNFPHELESDIKEYWQTKNLNPYINPGKHPRSEHETVFFTNLVKRYKPKNIIIISSQDEKDYWSQELEQSIEERKSIKVYKSPKVPGSLGSWSESSLGIPSYQVFIDNNADAKGLISIIKSLL